MSPVKHKLSSNTHSSRGDVTGFTDFIIFLVSSFFFVGFIPAIPGTFGSLAGVLIFYPIQFSPISQFILVLILVILGFLFSSKAENILNKKDPKEIVIDEVAGMCLSLMWLPYYDFKVFFLAFLLFRILDTLKAYPAGRIQNLHGSLGIMSDDLIAALYSNIILQIVLRIVP